MSQKHLLLQYEIDVNKIVECAKELKLNNDEIEKIFSRCFYKLKKKTKEPVNSQQTPEYAKYKFCTFCKKTISIFSLVSLLAIFIYVLLNVHQPTSSLVLRNVQGLIYPGLKILRFVSVPIIKRYPSLTDLYDESCLLENPYFYVDEMECWPCQSVYTVDYLTSNQSTYQSGIPYITKTSHEAVPYIKLRNLYKNHKTILNKESGSIKSTSYKLRNLNDVFTQNPKELSLSNIHVSWRINKMNPARIVRSLFPRPETLSPRSGQSVERYIMIDGAKASQYSLPNTECSYISLRQASGQRTIILKPSPECNHKCRPVSVVLKPSVILWYNWWYWRPVSLPVENATETSISYVSSYC